MAQLHKEFMLQVQGCLLKERCWLVVERHSPDMRWEWAKKKKKKSKQEGTAGSQKAREFGKNPRDKK